MAHLRTLIYTATSLRLRDRQQATHLNDLCALVTAVWQTKPGNCWIFTLRLTIWRNWKPPCTVQPDLPLINQPRRSSLKGGKTFEISFTAGKGGKLGLVCSGAFLRKALIFRERPLIWVIILGTGLPQPSAYQLALQTHFADTGLDAGAAARCSRLAKSCAGRRTGDS
ncbi:MAG: hypothetical protein IPM37_22950 [Hahellaceae bacterium]|nr:hypothetical protein [Hahellaceae bacterium]